MKVPGIPRIRRIFTRRGVDCCRCMSRLGPTPYVSRCGKHDVSVETCTFVCGVRLGMVRRIRRAESREPSRVSDCGRALCLFLRRGVVYFVFIFWGAGFCACRRLSGGPLPLSLTSEEDSMCGHGVTCRRCCARGVSSFLGACAALCPDGLWLQHVMTD